MKVTKVSWDEARTINVGNYNSVRIQFGVEAEVGPKETAEEIQVRVKTIVRDVIDIETAEILNMHKNARKG